MTDRRRRLGELGERLARRHLEASGYKVLETNHRTKSGEIDLIAKKDGTLVFVEVRTRTGTRMGSPEESLTPDKRQRLAATAEEYLQATNARDVEWRVDLVAVEFSPGGTLQRLEVLENAVEL